LHNSVICLTCPYLASPSWGSQLWLICTIPLPALSWQEGNFGASGTGRVGKPRIPRSWYPANLPPKMLRPMRVLMRWCYACLLCGGLLQPPREPRLTMAGPCAMHWGQTHAAAPPKLLTGSVDTAGTLRCAGGALVPAVQTPLRVQWSMITTVHP
jgi:hypothetical protein